MLFGKRKIYGAVRFTPDVLEQAVSIFKAQLYDQREEGGGSTITYWDGDAEICVRSPDEHYRKIAFASSRFSFNLHGKDSTAHLNISYDRSYLSLTVDDLEDISRPEKVCEVLDSSYSNSRLSTKEIMKNVKIFIGHGRSRLWRDLKDHLHDQHGVNVIAYETGARAGYTIHEVLQEMSTSATLALLIHTGEDIDIDGLSHARENVVHETGLFQGKLGFKKAIVVLEDGTSEFSNIAGLQQIRFSKGNIREIFGDVLGIIKREFGS